MNPYNLSDESMELVRKVLEDSPPLEGALLSRVSQLLGLIPVPDEPDQSAKGE